MMNSLNSCRLCPRNCGVDRLDGGLGYCGAGDKVKIARAALHFWEEPCLSGKSGSGTVFFSHCSLKCIYCQNYNISQSGHGREITISRLSEIFLELQEQGALNINLVTPTHYVPQIIEALKDAKGSGLVIPIIYNSSGYESLETVSSLKGYIDVYLPDIKYYDDKYAELYSSASGYFEAAGNAVKEMLSQVGEPVFDEAGIMKKGVIVRHLMLPGMLFDSKKIIDFIFSSFRHSVYISIMNQYTPVHRCDEYPNLNKTVNPKHYDSLINYALNLGVKNGFIQDGETSLESFIPPFDLTGV